MRDILFLLKESFADGAAVKFYCPQCAEINGVLNYFPSLRHSLDIRYVDFPKPRQPIVELIGDAHQGCPVLVLADKPGLDALEMMSGEVRGKFFVSGPREIAMYWAHLHGISRPH